MSEFTRQLADVHEQHSERLQKLSETFRIRNAELRKERAYNSSLFSTWEVLLQEVEVDSQVHGDISRSIGQEISSPILEKTFHRKAQSRKVFAQRDSFETLLKKVEEILNGNYEEYNKAYRDLLQNRNHTQLGVYYDAHNKYIQQLYATNGMSEEYYQNLLPSLMTELEDVYVNLSDSIQKSISGCAKILKSKTEEQVDRYDMIDSTAKSINSKNDMVTFIKSLSYDSKTLSGPEYSRKPFLPPQVESQAINESPDQSYTLNDEVVLNRLAEIEVPSKPDTLRTEAASLESRIKQLRESLDCQRRLQERNLESCYYNNVNDAEESIGALKYDLRVAQIHLAAINCQLELFKAKLGNKLEDSSAARERKMSSTSSSGTGSIKNKWMRAFRSLKAGHSTAGLNNGHSSVEGPERKNSKACPNALPEYQHVFQEYTYRKITGCDFCGEMLRGHVRQGVKCKLCKKNYHADCMDKVPKCQPKPKLLRRQKSSSDIEAKIVTEIDEEKPQDVDPIYQLLKQAVDLGGTRRERDGSGSGGGGSSSSSLTSLNRRGRSNNINPPGSLSTTMHGGTSSGSRSMLTVVEPSNRSSTSAPHSPQRQKLSLRMKSISLDSPESNERVLRRQHHHISSCSNSSFNHSPQSPVHNRRLLSTSVKCPIRMSSVDLPDETEKSLSSASTSPIPSPKPHRLLPQNLYVVLYDFRGRHQDELDLKAGYKITVVDTSDPDWWKGKCLGKSGFFPSKYVTKLHPGERALQVMRNIHVTDGANGMKLLRDQIVIQTGDEMEGMISVRVGDKQVTCPLSYLTEV